MTLREENPGVQDALTINQLYREGIMMKKCMMFTTAASLFLFFIVSVTHAQSFADLTVENQGIMAASNYMMSQAQKMKSTKDQDRAWLVDIGHQLITRGHNDIQAGEMDYSVTGNQFMQQIGRKLIDAGNLLLKIGRQKGPVTQKEKNEINTMADTMQGIGTQIIKQIKGI
jgi:hypothetical protein